MPSLLMMFSGVCINRLIILYTWGNSWFPMDFPSNPSSDTTQCVFLTVAIHFGNLYQTALLLARLQWVLTLLVCIDSSTGEWQVNGWFLQIWRVVYWIYETGKHLYVCSNRPFTMNGNFIVYTCIHLCSFPFSNARWLAEVRRFLMNLSRRWGGHVWNSGDWG